MNDRAWRKAVQRRAVISLMPICLALMVSGCACCPATHCGTTSIVAIARSLPAHPVAVGFDVDDTVLLSSPGFYYGQTNQDGPDGTNKYGPNPKRTEAFWNDMNTIHDAYSMPKKIAFELIHLHKTRGDTIYFITARPKFGDETLTAYLNRVFDLPNEHPVIFAGRQPKAEALRQHDIVLYYGDSDSDIRAAIEAGIRPVRILRSPTSTYEQVPHPGKFGEPVLRDSAF